MSDYADLDSGQYAALQYDTVSGMLRANHWRMYIVVNNCTTEKVGECQESQWVQSKLADSRVLVNKTIAGNFPVDRYIM